MENRCGVKEEDPGLKPPLCGEGFRRAKALRSHPLKQGFGQFSKAALRVRYPTLCKMAKDGASGCMQTRLVRMSLVWLVWGLWRLWLWGEVLLRLGPEL